MCEELELYALNALPTDEREAFEAHLASCGKCQRELPSLLATTEQLALAVGEVRPPARLKMRVLASIGEQVHTDELPPQASEAEVTPLRARLRRAPLIMLAAASIAVAFVLGTTFTQQAPAPRDDAGQVTAIPHPSTVMEEVMASPDATMVARKLKDGGEVSVAYSNSLNKAVFSAKGMEGLTKGQVYQLWLQMPGGKLKPAGSFSKGESLLIVDGDVATASALGVTVEPDAHQQTPTTTPMAFVSL